MFFSAREHIQSSTSEKIDFIRQLNRWFGGQKTIKQWKRMLASTAFFEDVAIDDELDGLHNVLLKHWRECFNIPLDSPRGIWTIANWNVFNHHWSRRESFYGMDSLLAHMLTAWLLDNSYQGWASAGWEEYMILNPASNGNMTKMTQEFNSIYNYKKKEIKFITGLPAPDPLYVI